MSVLSGLPHSFSTVRSCCSQNQTEGKQTGCYIPMITNNYLFSVEVEYKKLNLSIFWTWLKVTVTQHATRPGLSVS